VAPLAKESNRERDHKRVERDFDIGASDEEDRKNLRRRKELSGGTCVTLTNVGLVKWHVDSNLVRVRVISDKVRGAGRPVTLRL